MPHFTEVETEAQSSMGWEGTWWAGQRWWGPWSVGPVQTPPPLGAQFPLTHVACVCQCWWVRGPGVPVPIAGWGPGPALLGPETPRRPGCGVAFFHLPFLCSSPHKHPLGLGSGDTPCREETGEGPGSALAGVAGPGPDRCHHIRGRRQAGRWRRRKRVLSGGLPEPMPLAPEELTCGPTKCLPCPRPGPDLPLVPCVRL